MKGHIQVERRPHIAQNGFECSNKKILATLCEKKWQIRVHLSIQFVTYTIFELGTSMHHIFKLFVKHKNTSTHKIYESGGRGGGFIVEIMLSTL